MSRNSTSGDVATVSAATVQETITPPYTPSQRTRLVTDMLNISQEENDYTEEQWEDVSDEIRSLTDSELTAQWDATVGEWLLSRQDIPRHDHKAIQALAESDRERFGGDSVIVYYQKYKRLASATTADYGFLGRQTYRHESDVERREIEVELTANDEVAMIACPEGISVREGRMLLQQIEHDQGKLRQLAGDSTDGQTLSLPADILFGPQWDELEVTSDESEQA